MSEIKFCKDCKSIEWSSIKMGYVCTNIKIVDVVVGMPIECIVARDNLYGRCKKEAKYFEKKGDKK